MKAKLILWILVLFLLVGSVSAWDFDNVKRYDEAMHKLTIVNSFGLGDNLVENTLKANSCNPLGDCYAEIDISLYEEGNLFDEIEFKNTKGDKVDLSYYDFFINKSYVTEHQEPIYKEICNEVSSPNGTRNDCYNKLESYKTILEVKEKWVKYNVSNIEDIGRYKIRLEGKITQKTDWLVTSKGKQLTEWAWWDANWLYYKSVNVMNNDSTKVLMRGSAVNVTLDTTGTKFLDNGDDIRITYTNASGEVEINRYNLTAWNSATTAIIFQVQKNISASANDSNYRIYYSNPSATNPLNNRRSIYSWWEGFEDTGYLNQFNFYGGTPYSRNCSTSTEGACSMDTLSPGGQLKWFLNNSGLGGGMGLTEFTWEYDFYDSGFLGALGTYLFGESSVNCAYMPTADANYFQTADSISCYSGVGSPRATAASPKWFDIKQTFYGAGGVLLEVDAGRVQNATGTKYINWWELQTGSPRDFRFDNFRFNVALTANSPVIGLGLEHSSAPPAVAIRLNISQPQNITYTTTTINLDVSNDTGTNAYWWYSNATTLAGLGLINTTFTPNTTLSNLPQGTNIIMVGTNSSGGSVNQSIVTFWIDTIPPDIRIVQPTNKSYNTNSINLNISNKSLDNQAFWYSNATTLAGLGLINTTFTPNTTLSNLPQGTNIIMVGTNDSRGWANSTMVTFFIDILSPSVSITHPLNATYTTDVTSITYSATDANLNTCQYSTNGGDTNTTFTCGNPLTGLTSAQGSNTWIVSANDTANNLGMAKITFFKDTIIPSVSIKSPLNQTYNTLQTTFNATILDASLAYCWYSTNLGVTNTTLTCGANATGLNSGQDTSTWYFYANDSVGHLNQTSITFFVDSIIPNIGFQSPIRANNTNITGNTEIYANVSVTEVNELNITFTLVNLTSQVNQTTFTNGARWFRHAATLNSDHYYYNVSICDVANNCNTTDTRKLTIDYLQPKIEIVYPTNTSYNTNSLNLNVTCRDVTTQCTGYIYSFDNGLTNYTFTPNTTITASEGSNALTYFANDSLNNWNKTQVTFYTDTTFPIISITSPTNKTYGSGAGINLNFSIVEINPSSNYYDVYDLTAGASEIAKTMITGNATFDIDYDGLYNLTLYSNDTINNTRSASVLFGVNSRRITSFAQNYAASVYEGAITPFGSIVEINNLTTTDVNAILFYNHTNYTTLKTILGDNKFMFNVSLSVPLIETSVITKNLNWSYNLNLLGGGNSYNLTYGGSQTLNRVLVNMASPSCNSSSTNLTLILTIANEDIPSTTLNATLETEINYWKEDFTLFRTFINKSEGKDTYYICLNTQGQPVSANVYFKYTTDTGFTHRYYLNNYSLDTSSPASKSLYNYNNTISTSDLRITTRHYDTYQYYPGVYVTLQRNYVGEGIWRDVQMDRSGDYGLAFFNIREEDTDYKIIFKDANNNVLRTTDSMKFSCTSGICDLVFQLSPYSTKTNGTKIVFSSSFNNQTKMVTGNWSASNTIMLKFFARKPAMVSSNNICETIQSGDSGSFSCNLTGYTGEIYIAAEAGNTTIFSEYIKATTNKLGDLIGGKEGAWWAFVIILVVVMFGIFSPAGAVISMIIGLIAIFYLGIFNPLTITFLIMACVIGIIIGLKVRT